MRTLDASIDLLHRPDGRTALGESPVWDAGTGDFWWVDIDGRKVLNHNGASSALAAWDLPETPGFVVLTAPGRPAIGMETGIFLFDPARGTCERVIAYETAGQRFNDATVDAGGRLWTSTIALDAQPGQAAIWFVAPGLSLEKVAGGLAIPNGLAVDGARGRLFYSDSHPEVQTIWTRPLAPDGRVTGTASVFATTQALAGRPDGAALDIEGRYWIAGVDGAALHVFDPEGGHAAILPLPFSAPTKPAFFGADLRRIAITSKAIGDDGGYLALVSLPVASVPGLSQPYWAFAQ